MIRDYKCIYNSGTEDIPQDTQLDFPEVHLRAEPMAKLSVEMKQNNNAAACTLPFCHTAEADALGAAINYGDKNNGPRVREYVCSTVDDLLALDKIDYSIGRMKEILSACTILKQSRENVIFQVTGPFTLLGSLIDMTKIFRFLRKEPEKMKAVFDKTADIIIKTMDAAQKAGADIISYADPVAGVNIIGPKLAEQIAEEFTLPMLIKADKILDKNIIIHLCPKTAYSLIDTKLANEDTVICSKTGDYIEKCLEKKGEIRFTGHKCIKSKGDIGNNLQYLTLKQR